MTEKEKSELIAFGTHLMEKGNRPSAIRDVFRNRVRDTALRNELLNEVFKYKPPVKKDDRTPEQRKKDLDLMKGRHVVSDLKDQNKHSRNLGILTIIVGVGSFLFGIPYGTMTLLQGILVLSVFMLVINRKAYHLIAGVILSLIVLVVAELLLFGMPVPFFQDIFSTRSTRVIIIWNQVTPFVYLGFKGALIMLISYNWQLKRRLDQLPEDIREKVDLQ